MEAQQVYKNKKAAHDYLVGKGYAISQRAFYNHCGDGKCAVQKNKSILLVDLVDYIERHLNADQASGDSALARRERLLEVQIKEEKLKKLSLEGRKEDERWLLKEESDERIAALLAISLEMVRQRFSIDSSRLVHSVGGDIERMPEFINQVEETIEAAFNDMAGGHEFDVVFNKVEGGN